MSKTIWHLGDWGWGYGSKVLQSAVHKTIRDRAEEDIEFVLVDSRNTYFSPQLIAKLNEEADMLLLSGHAFVFHRAEDNSHSGWQFNIETSDIDSIDVPIVAYGVEYSKFPYDHVGFSDAMWESVNAVVEKSEVFSVRNNGTYDVMSNNGVTMDNVTVVPDASIFAEAYSYTHSCLSNDRLKIGFNWATDMWNQRFDISGDTNHPMIELDTVLNVLKEKAFEHNAYVYLIEHLMPNENNRLDKDLLQDRFESILGTDGYVVAECMAEELFPPYDYKAAMFVDIYRQMDFSIGMRAHTNIISFGQNTPCIGIGESSEVGDFLNDVSLGDLLVRLDKDTEGDINELRVAIDDVVTNLATHKSDMDATKTQLEIIKDTFVDQLLAVL